MHEIVEVVDSPTAWTSTFSYRLAVGLEDMSAGNASYRIVSGVDFLTIDHNQIQLLDLDETEFAIKEYPLAVSSSQQTYRAYGIVIADNGLSTCPVLMRTGRCSFAGTKSATWTW